MNRPLSESFEDVDLDWVEQVRSGTPEAFRALVERHQQRVYRVVVGMLRDPHEAEDLAQDVFLAAYRNLGTFDPARGRFRTWLLSIARNKCLNWLQRKRPLSSDQLEPEAHRGPTEALAEAEFFAELDRGLAALPLPQRMAFVLAEIEGLSQQEIAEMEQVRVGTIKSRLHRAKVALRRLLGDPAELK